ncbi:hypothetical protein [Mucisphaera calidilacus]|uniref:Lipoprotein n=1 Tax=Mucisphaera calidilacus TaxID=2527982 RepID=A0A518BXL6_9BACT|nr:hypothetical protein [Mucisphaera calidilacus]QDU71715.1 hypothetical protein Pan265_15680 [Mucisphaera calidilacus]
MMHRWFASLIAVATVCVGLLGCEGPALVYTDDGVLLQPQRGSGLVPKLESNWLIPDVPTPIGFQPLTSQCMATTDGMTRTVTHVYQGRTNISDAVKFYRQNLRDPRLGWVFEGVGRTDDGVQILDYTKGAEAMQIRILTDAGLTTIQVDITPLDMAPAAS